eukprot:gene15833-19341_t
MKKQALVLALASCGLTAAFSVSAQEKVRIGFMSPVTGPQAANGIDNRDGALLALKEINAKGIDGLIASLVQRNQTNAGLKQLVAQQGTTVIADASALSQFDSSAIAVLLACRREALAAGKVFSVQGLPARLRQLAGLYGVAELIPVAA